MRLADAALLTESTVITVIASVTATIITGVVAYLTKRSGDETSEHNQHVVSRTDMEKDAFVRAEGVYTKAIELLERELASSQAEVQSLRSQLAGRRPDPSGPETEKKGDAHAGPTVVE